MPDLVTRLTEVLQLTSRSNDPTVRTLRLALREALEALTDLPALTERNRRLQALADTADLVNRANTIIGHGSRRLAQAIADVKETK